MTRSPAIDLLLDSVSKCFDLEAAKALAEMEIDHQVEERIVELGQKAGEGELSEEERREYETYVNLENFVAILQAKARARFQPPSV